MTNPSSPDRLVELHGTVTTGDRKAREFLSLAGYTEQFIDKLGYEPYPGTLNLKLDDESVSRRSALNELDPIPIDKWEDGATSYGGVLCYPSKIEDKNQIEMFDTCHLVVPNRTTHEDAIVEVVAPRKLRTELNVDDRDSLRLTIWSH